MDDQTISSESAVGKRLDRILATDTISYLTFNNNKVKVGAEKITLGRASTSDIVVDNKLASRNHAVIQRIREVYFIKDMESTNGTLLNGERIPPDKYVRIRKGDKITIGNDTIALS